MFNFLALFVLPCYQRTEIRGNFYRFHNPSSRSLLWALLEEPLIGQPVKNFPAFHGAQRFNTVFTRALHWSLSWDISISKIHIDIAHSPTSWSSQWSLSFWLSHQYPIRIPLLPHSCYIPRPSYPFWLDYSNYTCRRVQVMKLLIMQFSPTSCHCPNDWRWNSLARTRDKLLLMGAVGCGGGGADGFSKVRGEFSKKNLLTNLRLNRLSSTFVR
jgi:hypothetical protein